MKKSITKAIVFSALIGVASTGMAEEIRVGFDGTDRETISFTEMLNASRTSHGIEATQALSIPEVADTETASEDLEIKVKIKSGSLEKAETLLCQAGRHTTDTKNCTKKSDLSPLTTDEADAMMLRKYFPAVAPSFTGLAGQSRHSYTNQSGPQTFHCVDDCKTVCKPVRKETKVLCGMQNALPVYCVEVTIVQDCKEECTHACECIAGCYN